MFQKLFKGRVIYACYGSAVIDGERYSKANHFTLLIPKLNNKIVTILSKYNYRNDGCYDPEEEVVILREWSWFRFKYRVIGPLKNLNIHDREFY